jgi:hypothetical protein
MEGKHYGVSSIKLQRSMYENIKTITELFIILAPPLSLREGAGG